MAQVIITKNGTGSATPTSLVQGELGLNVSTGQLFYGTSGSQNAVSSSFVFSKVTASGDISSSGTVTANKFKIDELGAIFESQGGYKFGQTPVPITVNHVTASGNISASTLDIATNIKVNNMPAGVDNSVVILDSDNVLKTDEVQAAIFNTSDAIITAATANETLAGVELPEVTVGAATAADTAKTTRTTTNAGFFPVMVDSTNASATAENLVTPTAGFEFNPSTKTATIGFVSATNITASQNISASGDLFANELILKGASAGISIEADSATEIITTGTSPFNITSGGDLFLLAGSNEEIRLGSNATNDELRLNKGHITASGNINTTGIIQVEGVNAIDYISTTHLFGANSSFMKLRSTVGIEMTAPVTASGPVSSSEGFIGEQHILRCLPYYVNDNPLIQNSLYFGSTLNHQPSNWNDPQAIGGDPNTVTSFDISDDDQNWGMVLPFDVSRIEVQNAGRPGGTHTDNFTACLYTASRVEGNETTITLGLATASSTNFDGSGRYTNLDIDYRPDTVIPKGTMLYFGVGTNTSSPTAKNARGYHTILVTKASVS